MKLQAAFINKFPTKHTFWIVHIFKIHKWHHFVTYLSNSMYRCWKPVS